MLTASGSSTSMLLGAHRAPAQRSCGRPSSNRVGPRPRSRSSMSDVSVGIGIAARDSGASHRTRDREQRSTPARALATRRSRAATASRARSHDATELDCSSNTRTPRSERSRPRRVDFERLRRVSTHHTEAVVVREISVTVVRRDPPFAGRLVGVGSSAPGEPIGFVYDLDAEDPDAQAAAFFAANPITVRADEPIDVHIAGTTTSAYCQWRVHIDAGVGDESQRMTVDDHVLPFQTTGGDRAAVRQGSRAARLTPSWSDPRRICDHPRWRSGSPKSTRTCARRVRRFVETNIPPAAARAAVDAETRDPARVLGRAVASRAGSACTSPRRTAAPGYGLVEQAVVIEELGRACAPGPYLADRDRRRGPRGRRRPRGRARCCRSSRPASAPARSRSSGARPVLGGARRRRDRVRGRRRLVRARRGRRARERSCRASTSPGTSPSSTSPACSRPPIAGSPGSRPSACATSPRCCSRPRRSASRSGASTPRPSTRRCACSSAGRSASSRA